MARMSRAKVREAQKALRKIGWPIRVDGDLGPRTREAIEDFKRGYCVAPFSRIDGKLGPITLNRLQYCARHGGKASPHFTFRECRSKGNGWIKVHRDLLRGMEEYRRAVRHPVALDQFSVYRDPAHNAAVGGARDSQHKYGNAVDLTPELSAERVKGMRRFSGIGIQRANGRVRHVDVRHKGPNTTGGTVANPTIWYYG